jgi:hypothetical protein
VCGDFFSSAYLSLQQQTVPLQSGLTTDQLSSSHPQFLDVIYHADGNKEKCDLRRKTTGFPPRTLNRRKMGGLKVVRMGKIMLPEQILAVIVAV